MAHDEASFVQELREALLTKHPLAYARKLHGGPFQAGLPDLMVALADRAALVEAKWIADDAALKKPFKQVVVDALTERQLAELATLGGLDGPLRARVVVGVPLEGLELPGNKATFAAGLDLAHLAACRADLTLGDLVGSTLWSRQTGEWQDLTACVDRQVRLRGDSWLAALLLFGPSWWARRTAKDK